MKPTHAIRSSGRVSTTAVVCWANVSPFACSEIRESRPSRSLRAR
jgi:hypothetical protein